MGSLPLGHKMVRILWYNSLKHKYENFAEATYTDNAAQNKPPAYGWHEVKFNKIKLANKDLSSLPKEQRLEQEEIVLNAIKKAIQAAPKDLPDIIEISDHNVYISYGVVFKKIDDDNDVFKGMDDDKIKDYTKPFIGSNCSIGAESEKGTRIGIRLKMDWYSKISAGCDVNDNVTLVHNSSFGTDCKVKNNVILKGSNINGENNVGRAAFFENKFVPRFCDTPSWYNNHKFKRIIAVMDDDKAELEKETAPSNIPDFLRAIGGTFKFSDEQMFGFYIDYLGNKTR